MSRVTEVWVGLATCGIAAGAEPVYSVLESSLAKHNLPVTMKRVGCIGMCYNEPLVDVVTADGNRFTYGHVRPEDTERIVTEHVLNGQPVNELLIPADGFFKHQVRIVLENCGLIDPEVLEEYQSHDGYKALQRVLLELTPVEVIEEIKLSGLRGRGGAGFPTGVKWDFAAREPGPEKFLVCNADEGDPGAFMDRSVLEGDPHRVIEGMIIAAYAIGAPHGYIYVRAEYPMAIKRLKKAIAAAGRAGFLGENILGSAFSFEIKIKTGAGAFVCGEETALIASIEGKRGTPRRRPPYPAVSGLWGKPTNINNVETLANIPWIIRHGAKEFAHYGTEDSRGTKVFALAGKINHSGLIEV
ncbi:NADH-quinone oxidoreductase subunit F, partial [Candidatus Bipolaricaulota bacterium]|nr:NADH-quinone oxidoreductase subunit F [Candidatus Bipolaricaulota bacterium]